MKHVDFLVYGKIIIDHIRLGIGQAVADVLGGGGPQAAFGARLWGTSVGLLSRSGEDIAQHHVQSLRDLDIDLSGWQTYADIATPHGRLIYDDGGDFAGDEGLGARLATPEADWFRLLEQALPIPAHYERPRAVHLITEFPDEPLIEDAARLRENGALLSLEPLLDDRRWANREPMLALMQHVDIVSPDWPAASAIAGSQEPETVLRYWSKLGPQMVTIRRGPRGSYAWDALHDTLWRIPPVAVEVVDPTGAGNSYGGGACVGWTASQDARVAAFHGAVSASFLVSRVGLPKISPALCARAAALLESYLDRAQKL